MRHFDEELRQLQMQAAAKNRLETVLQELKKQKSELEVRVHTLVAQKDKEQLGMQIMEFFCFECMNPDVYRLFACKFLFFLKMHEKKCPVPT